MANWVKLLYVLVVALLYVPMVFLGANVFFPEYTGTESYFRGTEECYPQLKPQVRVPEQQEYIDTQQGKINECLAEQNVLKKEWNDKRNVYNGWKYAAITGFNLLILLIVLFITFQDAVIMGIFFGTVATVFGATISYWEYARTKFGFILMLIMFFAVIFFINRRQKMFSDKDKKKK